MNMIWANSSSQERSQMPPWVQTQQPYFLGGEVGGDKDMGSLGVCRLEKGHVESLLLNPPACGTCVMGGDGGGWWRSINAYWVCRVLTLAWLLYEFCPPPPRGSSEEGSWEKKPQDPPLVSQTLNYRFSTSCLPKVGEDTTSLPQQMSYYSF